MKKIKLFFSICLCLSIFSLSSCNSTNSFVCFSTLCEFDVTGNLVKREIKEIYNDFQTLEGILSTADLNSDTTKINVAKKDQPVLVSDDFIALFEIAKQINNISKNYNPAIFPIVELWGFDTNSFTGILNVDSIPTEEEINYSLSFCDMDYFLLDKNTKSVIKTLDQAKLDFGSIAKGYACEIAYNKLNHNKFAVINIGGTVKTSHEITVHVKNPNSENKNPYSAKIILPSGMAIATSGDYERYYYYDEVKYHHLIASNGYPAWISHENPILSVSIIGKDATICDALSTLVFVEGVTAITKQILVSYSCSALIVYKNSHRVLGDLDYSILDETFKNLEIN